MSPADSRPRWPAADAAPAGDPADRPRGPAELLGQLRDRLEALPLNHPSAPGETERVSSGPGWPGRDRERAPAGERGPAPDTARASDAAGERHRAAAPEGGAASDPARDGERAAAPEGGAASDPARDGERDAGPEAETDRRTIAGRAAGTQAGWPGGAAADWSGALGGRADAAGRYRPWFAGDGRQDPWFTASEPGDPWFAGPADGIAAGEPD